MKQKPFNLKKQIARVDPMNVGLTISLLGKQIAQVEKEFPKSLSIKRKPWKHVVVCAMGGSALGADMLRYMYEDSLTAPIIIINGYDLPAYVGKDSFVIVITYSGTTEESITCYEKAKKLKSTVVTISSGSTLASRSKKDKVPHYVFTTENNPSGQPRMGTGYTMTAVYLLLERYGFLKKNHSSLIQAAKNITVDTAAALRLGKKMQGLSVILIGAEHLRGNTHVMSNQMNESAKTFAPFYFISELNHHLLEGLDSLKLMQKRWLVIMFESSLYASRIKKRFVVTEKVLKKQGFSIEKISFTGNRVEQSLRMLAFGSWVSYYHSIVAGRDPSLIPWVDYFKKQLR